VQQGQQSQQQQQQQGQQQLQRLCMQTPPVTSTCWVSAEGPAVAHPPACKRYTCWRSLAPVRGSHRILT
jgi:hypothetical protein